MRSDLKLMLKGRPAKGLEALFDIHRQDLLRFLCARCGNADDAEDLLQELWLKASAAARVSRSGPIANGRAYLFRMANNLVLDTRRARMRAMARDHEWGENANGAFGFFPEERRDNAEPVDEQLAREQECAVLHDAISTLPSGARRALQLHRLEGLPQAEVAQAMGMTRSGVEKHLATAMKHLRKKLANCGLLAPVTSNDDGSQNLTDCEAPKQAHRHERHRQDHG